VEVKLNVARQLLSHADDVNLLVDNKDTIKKNTKILIDASEIGLEINARNLSICYYLVYQNIGQNQNIQKANKSFENVLQFKYFGTTVASQNLI
jgi:hypothetical protein